MKWNIALLATQIVTTALLVYCMIEVFCVLDDLYEETYKFNAYHESLMKQARSALNGE